MEQIAVNKITLLGILGAIGGFLAWLFGGWTTDLQTLLIFMAIDYATGLILAGVFKKSPKSCGGALESRAGLKGLCRKCGILLAVLVAYRLDIAVGADYIRTSVIIAFIANEAISIIENIGLMGVPLPGAIKKAIEVLRSKNNIEQR